MFQLNAYNEKIYKILSREFFSELSLELVEIIHLKTKAKIILGIKDDENRVFNITFKTPVKNSKGTPHILEHSVLCGSKKYDVKDPFIELAKGSMNTFLNAMTFPDKTCYPVASANEKDFHNLVSVYLDAVFYPNAIKNENIFMQEGWHYEIQDKNEPLKVNGIVYNEMKGVYSNPDSLIETLVLETLFSGTNYEYESGGAPREIIDLTFDEFKDFHKKYYSASNSIIYFYGQLDFNYELYYLQEEYLKNMEYIEVEAIFNECNNIIKEKEIFYNCDDFDLENKNYIAYSFSIKGEKDNLKHIVLSIIDYYLFSSKSAILRDYLMNEGYGETVYSQYENGLKNGFFSIVAQNISLSKKEQFIKIINDTINRIFKNGFDIEKLKAGINNAYFDYSENENGSMPTGLIISLQILDSYLYEEHYNTFVGYKKEFDYLKSIDLNDKNNIFYEVLNEVFINNNFKNICVLKPKNNYSSEKENELNKLLADRKNNLSDDDINNYIAKCDTLKEYQETKNSIENLSKIPCIGIEDIEKNKKSLSYKVENNSNVDTIVSFDNDKDIVYLGLKFDISDFSSEEIYLFSLIKEILTNVNLKNESYKEFNNFVDINTGGLKILLETTKDKLFFSFEIKTIQDKLDCAFEVFFRLFSYSTFFDVNRISVILNSVKSMALNSVINSGHISAFDRANSKISFKSMIADKTFSTGIAFNKFINKICDNYFANSGLINDTLELLYKKLHRRKMFFTVSTNEKYYQNVISEFKKFTEKISANKMKHIYTEQNENKLVNNISQIKNFIPFDEFEKKSLNEAIVIPSDVNFVAVASTYEKEYYSGIIMLLKVLFNYEYLWTNIRVLGGAYGCMSFFDRDGSYGFVSYRDPNLSSTNKTYEGISMYLQKFSCDDKSLKKYIISTISRYDNPISTYMKYKKNVMSYFNGIDDDIINREREDVLNAKVSNIIETYKIFESINNKGEKCALISATLIEEAKKEYDDVWNLID